MLYPGTIFLGELTGTYSGSVLGPADLACSLQTAYWPTEFPGPTAFDVVLPHDRVCIVVSDQTRKTACDQILSLLMKEWLERGCRITDFTILIATGIHRPPTQHELSTIIGPDLFAQLQSRVFSHNPDDDSILVQVGTTKRGHAVRVNRRAIEADKLILIGTASFHYHAGFGGGRKLLVPGLASRDTIAYNHSLTLDPEQNRTRPGVGIGLLDGNAVAEEMLECARLCHPDLLINTVLLADGHSIVGVHAGELDLAHRAACKQIEAMYRVDITEQADIVIADATGAPNWIQSHKALFNASLACKPDGTIILLAPCPEGIGDEGFRQWMTEPTITALYERLRKAPEILGQTALSTRERGTRTILVTGLNDKDKATLAIRCATDTEAALNLAIQQARTSGRKKPTLYSMPQARYTVPFLHSPVGKD